nr:azole transporter [Trichoderma atroviride]
MTVDTASSGASEFLVEPKNDKDVAISPNEKRVSMSNDDNITDTEAAANVKDNQLSGFKWFLVCACVYISDFVYGLDTTIAADIQGAVTQTFGTVDQLTWLGAGFALGSTAVILPGGTLFNSFDQKRLYIAGVMLFEVGSALCGAVPNMNGGTGIYLGTLNFSSSHLISPEQRGAYIFGISIVWGLGAVLAPAIGGAFSISKATWRWGFYINLVLGAIAAPIWLFLLPYVHPTNGISIKESLLRLDFLGFLLSAGAWTIFAVIFIATGNSWEWQDKRTSIACAISGLYVPVYYIPVYFQFVESDSPLKAAVRILPLVLVAVAVSFSSGSLLAKVKFYKPHYLVSGVLITLGSALFYRSILITRYTVATLKVLPEDIGNAISLQNLAQIGGTTIALVIAGQVFQTAAFSNLSKALSGQGYSAAEIHDAVAGAPY